MGKLHVGQYFRLSVATKKDLSGASALKVNFKAPDKSIGEWSATIDPENNTKMYYDVTALSQAGKWYVYAEATFSYGTLIGRRTSFIIYKEGE